MHDFDIIIVGGGVAGLSLALSLSDTALNIAVFEARDFVRSQGNQHARVSAYNLASQELLSKLGAWALIPPENKGLLQHIEVWDSSGDGHINFDSVDIAKPMLGNIVQNEAVVKALRECLQKCDNIRLFCPKPLNKVEISEHVIVHCDDGHFSAKLIIGADGANSWLREKLTVPMRQASYDSSALIANVRTELPHKNTARQVFLSTGPLAFLPLADPHVCSVVWSTTSKTALHLKQLSAKELCSELTRASESRLGGVVELLDQPLVFPLMMRHVQEYVGQRWALVGDAAHTIHPLAGQGINLGLQDILALSETIKSALDCDRDIGFRQNLRPYERARKGDNQLMIYAMQSFKTLFGTDFPILKSARNIGFNLVDASVLAKRFFMRTATGLQR